jgi:hypothetical protein
LQATSVNPPAVLVAADKMFGSVIVVIFQSIFHSDMHFYKMCICYYNVGIFLKKFQLKYIKLIFFSIRYQNHSKHLKYINLIFFKV